MSEKDFPRVLVVSAGDIASPSGTGITLRNLFAAWPASRIAQIHFEDDHAGEARGVRRMRYPRSQVPADRLLRAATRGRRVTFADGAPKIAAVPLEMGASRSVRRHAAARAFLDMSPLLPSSVANRFVDEFSPQVVYSLLGSVRVIRLATRMAVRSGVPLVPHFMDDWPSTLYTSGELRGMAQNHLRSVMRKALSESSFALCISDEMSAEYSVRFGIPCVTFMNPVECSIQEELPSAIPPLEFLYVGGLHLGRWDSLVLIATALEDGKAQLRICAPDSDMNLAIVPWGLRHKMIVEGSLDASQVRGRLAQADILVHVESFDAATRAFVRLSMSTKIPQYLAAGRPILAVGPPELASIRIVDKGRAGLAVTSTDPERLARVANSLVSNERLRSAMGAEGRRMALKEFSTGKVRERFRCELLRAARV